MAISRMADLVGHVLGGRYRLVAPIGTGASARVLLADDVRLHRQVAVKLLHPGLADDDAFLRRFRAEARAAAALTHPNIMRVYDWGEDEDGPYLVMEHLSGGSLRDLLDAGHRLTPSQATAVGIDTALALDHAHRRGFVHRDIKPANLLFDDEGRVCIADFGLARALAEAAWTEPSGAVLGTARYASPEQAKGLAADGKADVYALALVLVEAVTGQVPFAADTTIATLMARVDATYTAPAELGPLGEAVEVAAAANPLVRPDAAGLARVLHAAARDLPAPHPLPAVTPGERGRPDAVPADPTELGLSAVGATRPADPAPVPAGSSAAPDARFSGTDGSPGDGPTAASPVDGAAAGSDPDTGTLPAVYDHETDPTHPDEVAAGLRRLGRRRAAVTEVVVPDEVLGPDGRRRGRWRRTLVAAAVVVALMVAGVVGTNALIAARVPKHPVPTFVGLDLAAARAEAAKIGVTLDVARDRRDGSTPDEVLSQRPASGLVREGDEIDLVVSDGQSLTAVPDLSAVSREQAEAALAGAGLAVGAVDDTTAFHETAPKGSVLDWSPKGAGVEKGTAVALVLSAGPAPRLVPDLVGEPVDEAIQALKDLGFVAKPTGAFSDDVDKGFVISISPGPGGKAPFGSEVRVVHSLGPDVVPVPEVKGMTVADATRRIEAAGLQVGGVDGNPSRRATGTSPSAGKNVRRGSEVTIETGGRSADD